MRQFLVFTEQRCWPDDAGMTRGRKDLTALHTMATLLACGVASRPSARDDGHARLLPSQREHIAIAWPDSLGTVPTLGLSLVQIWRAIGRYRGVVVYAPGIVGSVAGLLALVRRRELVVVAVGDPRQALSKKMLPGLAGTALRGFVSSSMRLLCRRARVVRYVTRHALQREYPAGRTSSVFGATDVGPVAEGSVRSLPLGRRINFLTVATLDQPYKGVAELIEATALVRARGFDVGLRIAGTGRLRSDLEDLARTRLDDRVEFVGHLSQVALTKAYADADCFVLASWTEGLPRALVEAMAAGLPCIGTSVGGVPELLERERLVPPHQTLALASALEGLLRDQDGWHASSERNIRVALEVVADAARVDQEFAGACVEVMENRR